MTADCIGVIPARYASTRFPGKPLALIGGRPMIQWVYERALRAETLAEVLVATDDERIAAAVRGFGGRVRMTSPDHACGTDRLAEVAAHLPPTSLIVNVQGDEPLIAPEAIDLAVRQLQAHGDAVMSTLVTPCIPEDYENPNVVKAVLDRAGFALYFSRAPVPYRRSLQEGAGPWRHVGLYVYRRDFLLSFARLPPTPLERTECLEQLRALESGYRITCAVSPYLSPGVDTPDDIRRVEEELARREQEGAV